jgi:uncharacterized protein (DUF362 family)
MFYQCKNCNLNWQYPVEKCPECFSKTERTPSKKIKVASVSQVWITTPLHPKVPYFVLLLEDEQGRKWVQKSIKEYEVGQEYELDKALGDKNAVAIWRVKYDILEGIEKTLELLEAKINPGSRILILPTLIAPAHPYFAKNTSPQVLNQTIRFLIQKGVKKDNIKVAAQSFNDFPITASAHKSKILSVCEKNGVEFIDLAQKGFKRVEKGDFTFDVSKILFESDLVINLPIMKLDKKIGVRGALTNLTGLLKKESFLGSKYLYGEERMAIGLKEALPETLTIADAVSIQTTKNNFTAYAGLILASFNPLNLDSVFAKIAMVNLPEHLKSVNLKEIKVVGREIDEVQYDLEFMI